MIDRDKANNVTNRVQRVGTGIRRRVYPLDVLYRAGKQFIDDNAMTYAAATSYYVLFSLFPTMIFVVTIFGIVIQDPELQRQVVDAMISVLPPGLEVRAEVERVISDLSQASTPLLAAASILATAWTASNMFAALRRALNLAFNIEQNRNFLIARVMDMLNLPAVMLLGVFSVAMTAVARVIRAEFQDIIQTTLTSFAWNVLFFLLPYAVSFFAFLMLYRVLPNSRFPFRYLAIGAAFSAIGFELVKAGFSIYVENFGNYQEIYGALGGAVAFLFFVFIQANLVIFGAALSAQVIRDFYDDPGHIAELRGEGERHRNTGAWRRLEQ